MPALLPTGVGKIKADCLRQGLQLRSGTRASLKRRGSRNRHPNPLASSLSGSCRPRRQRRQTGRRSRAGPCRVRTSGMGTVATVRYWGLQTRSGHVDECPRPEPTHCSPSTARSATSALRPNLGHCSGTRCGLKADIVDAEHISTFAPGADADRGPESRQLRVHWAARLAKRDCGHLFRTPKHTRRCGDRRHLQTFRRPFERPRPHGPSSRRTAARSRHHAQQLETRSK